MDLKQFLKSRYYKKAQTTAGREKVKEGFAEKLKHAASNNLVVEKAKALYAYFRDPAVPAKNKVLIVAGLLYFINPWDALPDFVPGLGYIDDIGVLSMVLAYLSKELTGYEAEGEGRKEGFLQRLTVRRREPGSPANEPGVRGEGKKIDKQKRSLRSRLVGVFLDPYLRDTQKLQEERIARELEAKIKLIKLTLLCMIVAACISLAYCLIRHYLLPG